MKRILFKPDWKELTFPDVKTRSNLISNDDFIIALDIDGIITTKPIPMRGVEVAGSCTVTIGIEAKVPIIVEPNVRASYQIRDKNNKPITEWARCGYIDIYKGKEPLRKILKTKIQGTVTHVRKTLGMGN